MAWYSVDRYQPMLLPRGKFKNEKLGVSPLAFHDGKASASHGEAALKRF